MLHKSKGFTLLELMLVMILLSILGFLLIGNYMSSIKKGRDAKRKNDLSQLQKAFEMYYADFNHYPEFTSDAELFGKKFCDTYPDVISCSKIYMVKTPADPTNAFSYHYATDGTATPQSYYLFSAIENDQDQSQGVNIKGYAGVSCGTGILCRYYVSSTDQSAPASNP